MSFDTVVENKSHVGCQGVPPQLVPLANRDCDVISSGVGTTDHGGSGGGGGGTDFVNPTIRMNIISIIVIVVIISPFRWPGWLALNYRVLQNIV